MDVPSEPSAGLHRIGTYRRRVSVPPARVFENALDWEHLPWLHAQDFASIELRESGAWGWRARVGLRPESRGAIDLELLLHRENATWVSRPYGPGESAGEIWTQATPAGADGGLTDLEIAFWVPEKLRPHGDALFARYRDLYERLWDQDEAMSWTRERFFAKRRARSGHAAPVEVDLGSPASVRARLPLVVEVAGERFRLVETDGELVVHAATCPHWLGPLDVGPVVDGCVTCPWHGYRYDVRTGKSADGRGLELARPPALCVEGDRVVLRAAGARQSS